MGDISQASHEAECFYLETGLDMAAGEGIWLDKCWLVVVDSGSARLEIGKKEYEVNHSKVLFMRPELSLRLLSATDDFRVAVMAFPALMLHENTRWVKPDFILLLYMRIVWIPTHIQREIFEHFRALFRFAVSKYGQGYGREFVLSLVTGMVYATYEMTGVLQREGISADSSRSRELLQKFMQLLHRNFTTRHEVQFYAEELCISAKYLTQITKNLIGRTPKQLIDERIMHEATKLLDMNNSSVQDISVKLGFPDQSYFGRFFKRMKHISPLRYRMNKNQ